MVPSNPADPVKMHGPLTQFKLNGFDVGDIFGLHNMDLTLFGNHIFDFARIAQILLNVF